MLIKNFSELADSKEKKDALEIVSSGIEGVLPARVIRKSLRWKNGILTIKGKKYPLRGRKLIVIGGGKASGAMAQALEELLGTETITAGVVNSKSANFPGRKIRINVAGHPIPDRRGLAGVKEMLGLKKKYSLKTDDLIFCLISGGGSALLSYPVDEITLADKQRTAELLLKCGATIGEINTVRKHLSKIKGGWLSRFFSPVRMVSLILSDVIGDDLTVIASGPTYFDPSTFADAGAVLKKYAVWKKIPERVKEYLEKGLRGEAEETPKKPPDNTDNYLIGNNRIALEEMAKKARQLGYEAVVLTSRLEGEAQVVARKTAEKIKKLRFRKPSAIILAGETTVSVGEKTGRGGRCQEYVLASVMALADLPGRWSLLAMGSDGTDFTPDAAGGIIGHRTPLAASRRNLSPAKFLKSHDSYHFLESIGGLILTGGDTGTNVGDLILYVLNPEAPK